MTADMYEMLLYGGAPVGDPPASYLKKQENKNAKEQPAEAHPQQGNSAPARLRKRRRAA